MAPTTYADVAARRSHGEEDQDLSAATSTRKSHALSRRSEATPLLGDEAQSGGRRGSRWEGEADLQGLKWWRRPSVHTSLYEGWGKMANTI